MIIYTTMEDIREIPGRKNYFATRDGKILSKKRKEDAYLTQHMRFNKAVVVLYYDHMMRAEFVNRLILSAFVGFPADPWLCFAHNINGDPQDNRLENLEWLVAETTDEYDPAVSHRKGVLRPDAIKSKMTDAKLNQSDETKRKVREGRKRYFDRKRAAEKRTTDGV